MHSYSNSDSVRQAIDLLGDILEKMDEGDLFSAEVMLGVAIHMLECSKTDVSLYRQTEARLRGILNLSPELK